MKILITGSASGIGLACNNHFVNHYEIIELDKEQVDLSNPLDVEPYINDMPAIDALIYCAGVMEIKSPLDLSIKEWNDVFNINVTSNFVISKKLIQHAIKNKK